MGQKWTEEEISLLLDRDSTLQQIQSQLPHRTMRSIRGKCCKLGIRRKDRGKSHRRLDWDKTFLTEEMNLFLDGLMLSDGCIVGPNGLNRKQSYLKIGQKFKECRDYFVEPFECYNPHLFCENISSVAGGPKKHVRYGACTKTHPDFTEQYNRWYREGEKIVPGDVDLQPIVVYNWYIGDGSLYKRVARFHTQGFSAAYTKILMDKMLALGFQIRVDKVGDLRLTVDSTRKMLEYVGDFPPLKCYSYKFD